MYLSERFQYASLDRVAPRRAALQYAPTYDNVQPHATISPRRGSNDCIYFECRKGMHFFRTILLKPGYSNTLEQSYMKNGTIDNNKQNHERRCVRINTVNWRIEYWLGGAGNCVMTALCKSDNDNLYRSYAISNAPCVVGFCCEPK
jgi:hypothetical protein